MDARLMLPRIWKVLLELFEESFFFSTINIGYRLTQFASISRMMTSGDDRLGRYDRFMKTHGPLLPSSARKLMRAIKQLTCWKYWPVTMKEKRNVGS
jgi:hypothetical protein